MIKARPLEVGFDVDQNSIERNTLMNIKYIGMDVQKETISIAVMNGEGKLVMESIIETKASTILQFIHGLRGGLHVTLEEGTYGGLVVRPAEATRHQARGVRSPEKRPAEGRQLERQDGCPQARRSAARRISAFGLRGREWGYTLKEL